MNESLKASGEQMQLSTLSISDLVALHDIYNKLTYSPPKKNASSSEVNQLMEFIERKRLIAAEITDRINNIDYRC